LHEITYAQVADAPSAVEKPDGLGWLGRLRVAGVVGTIDTLAILPNNYYGSTVPTAAWEEFTRR
jgi:hypothetical protein